MLGQGLAGRLHIASVPTFAWTHLPPLLKAYAAQAPAVAVELSDPEPAEVLRQVAGGQADAGFVATATRLRWPRPTPSWSWPQSRPCRWCWSCRRAFPPCPTPWT
ncbi:DNA-binding transcriptional regulator IlvY [Arthrobacter crystallopoietes BAB-32]|uniref:DNA-binding transcriptional regulator IlvY n=1 Tax=Arthrobacter crystallopoietes BAB-32 TaxID=1246476 RepID=N1UZY9_9MICC|nr:DNA-binding transcriptional regulator IlvY [Arthrobacter crystallopoietes BAB-32]